MDLTEIEHVKKPGFFKACKAGTKHLELPMKNTSFDMGKYDLILAGSPTWNGRPSLFMKSFINKAQNIKGKKLAFFSTELSPLHARNQFIGIMNKNLENAELPPVDSFLAMQFRRGKLIDGAQNIDTFVNTVLEL